MREDKLPNGSSVRQESDDDRPGTPELPSRATLRREITIAVALLFALTMGLEALGYAVPFVRANLAVFFAVIFLQLPQRLLPLDGPGPERYGLTFAGTLRALPVGLALTAVVLAGFLPGQHLWKSVAEDRELHASAAAYARPGDRHHGDPAAAEPGVVQYFHLGNVQYVRWVPTAGPWRLTVRAEGEGDTRPALWTVDHRDRGPDFSLTGTTPREVVAAFRTTGAGAVRVTAFEDGEAVTRDAYRTGPGLAPVRDREWASNATPSLRVALGYAWLPLLILWQVALIALPEEFFYRGYLQRRMDEANGFQARFRLGPIVVSQSNLIVSAVFALGHFAIGFDPLRLAVFFPSLLFGWLRDKTGGIAAGVLFHAACNLMVEVVAVHYWQ